MPVLPIAPYEPDQPTFPGTSSANILNVQPKTASSYGPWAGLTAQSSALPERAQGAASVQDASGNVYNYAGTATALLEEGPGTTTFSDVSGTTYSTASTERWAFAYYFPYIVATNFGDVPQQLTPGGGNFANLIASGTTTLKARYAAVIKDWLFFGNTFDGTDSNQPQRVWWSAEGDPTNFPTPGTSGAAAVQSDFQTLIGEGGWVTGIVGNLGTSQGAVFQERAVWRVNYAGPPVIFDFQPAEGAVGCPAPGSIVQRGPVVYYYGEDGFKAFDGSASIPIGSQKLDRFVASDIDTSQLYRFTGAADPIYPKIFWAYPAQGATNCNRLVCYDLVLNRFTVTELDAIIIEVFLRSLTLGYSVESLDNIGTNIDADPPFTLSLDDRFYTGGRPLLTCFDQNHKLSYFTGSNLAATIDSSVGNIFPGKRARLNRIRPLVDTTSATVAILTKSNSLADATVTGSAVAMGTDGTCPQRADGRYHAARASIAAGVTWTEFTGFEVSPENGDAVPLGNR